MINQACLVTIYRSLRLHQLYIDDFHYFMGCGFTSGGQKLGSVFSAAVCKIQASKRYIESLPLVLEEAASLKVKGPLFSCLLITCLPSQSRTLN